MLIYKRIFLFLLLPAMCLQAIAQSKITVSNTPVNGAFPLVEAGRTATIYTDAADANENAEHYNHKTIQVNKKTKIRLPLAKGGGAVAYLKM